MRTFSFRRKGDESTFFFGAVYSGEADTVFFVLSTVWYALFNSTNLLKGWQCSHIVSTNWHSIIWQCLMQFRSIVIIVMCDCKITKKWFLEAECDMNNLYRPRRVLLRTLAIIFSQEVDYFCLRIEVSSFTIFWVLHWCRNSYAAALISLIMSEGSSVNANVQKKSEGPSVNANVQKKKKIDEKYIYRTS